MHHSEVLKKINELESFFISIGLVKIRDFPKDWDLDSSMKFVPNKPNFLIRFNDKDRILINVDLFIMGGVNFVSSGQMGSSVYASIRTDYDLNCKYDVGSLFKKELRDWRLDNLLNI